MQVVLADRDEAALNAVAQEIGNAAYAVPTDVTDPAALDMLADKAWAAHGQVDLLFNNAGITQRGLFERTKVAAIERVMAVNFYGSLYMTKAALPKLLHLHPNAQGP